MSLVIPPDGKITEHFTWEEARCRHCGLIPYDGEGWAHSAVWKTAEWLEKVREALGGHPIKVLSWCRCDAHNAAVGGAPHSYHLQGWAVDFVLRNVTPRQVQAELKKVQGKGKLIGGLGLYPGFTHADRGPVRRWKQGGDS